MRNEVEAFRLLEEDFAVESLFARGDVSFFFFYLLFRINHSRSGFLSFFFSFLLRKDTFDAPSALPVHSKSIRAFLQRASVTLRLHLWFSFHNTRINHPSDGNFGRWASFVRQILSILSFSFFFGSITLNNCLLRR